MIDVVIPFGPNDTPILPHTIHHITQNVIDLGKIYIVTLARVTAPDFVTWRVFDERLYPFGLKDVADIHGLHKRNGWYLQQLLKLYAWKVIVPLSENYLVWDADTILLKPHHFMEHNRIILDKGTEYHKPYFDHMARLHPGFIRATRWSGIVHHMVFSQKHLKHLFQMVEDRHGKELWRVYLEQVEEQYRGDVLGRQSGSAEYELFFHFMLKYYPGECILRELKWKNGTDAPTDEDFISCHYYLRTDIYRHLMPDGHFKSESFPAPNPS